MTLISEITLDGVTFNGVEFAQPLGLDAYKEVLGSPTRSESPGPPAPHGHRNNVLHFYDGLGLLLREHHATYLVDGIEILLEPTRWHFPTVSAYSGKLRVLGVPVDRATEFTSFARRSEVALCLHLGHAWYIDGVSTSIQLEVYNSTTNSSEIQLISTIAFGFSGSSDKRLSDMTFSRFLKEEL
jgi:hypothetical protein